MKNTKLKTAYPLLCARHLFSFLFFLFTFHAVSSAQVTNNALDLNGANGYASLGTIAPAGNFSSGLTLECWIKWDAFNSWSRLLELGNGPGSNNILFANESSTSKLRFEVYQNNVTQGLSTTGTMVTGRWYHVAVTQTSTGLTTLYLDGVTVASGNLQLPLNVSRSQCYIGRSSWSGDGYLDGKIDEMRIWNVVRTQAEIRQYMLKTVASNASGLVAYYKCNEGSGTTLINSCINSGAVNGTVYGGTSWIASPAQVSGNALGLDGTDDYVSIGAPLAANSSYTKEAWIYVTKSTAVPQNVISSNGSPLWIDGGTLRAGNNGATQQVTDPGSLPLNTWAHVALSYDASSGNMLLYRDGTLVSSATVANSYAGGNNYIGAWFNGSSTESYLGGKIDEVRIWNAARTQSEIQANMYKELDPASETALVAYYTFDQGVADADNAGMITIPDQKGIRNGTLVNMALTGSTSNFLQQKSNLFVLPVSFTAFTVQKQSSQVGLYWSTAGEQKMSDFIVEYSRNGKDWVYLATIRAAGNSNTINDYTYVHPAPATGLNYYRVSQKDELGKMNYSPVRVLLFEEERRAFFVPNTTIINNILQLQVNKPTVLSFYTQDGKMLWSKEIATGKQFIAVDNLTKGVYFLTGSGTTEKLLVQ